MPVTDLTGTTWVLNDTITFSYSPGLPNISSFNFTSNNTSFYGFYFDVDGEAENSLGYRTNQEYSFKQIYNSGGNIISGKEAYKTITITGGTDATSTGLISWLEANATQQAASSKLSVDLTTLSGWSNLAPGNHTIKIVAKGTGYRDSEKSAGVEVTKAPQVYTDCLTFTGETSEFTLKASKKEWNGTVEYSTDHNTWTVWNGSAVSSVGKKLYLRGSGNTTFYTSDGSQFVLSARVACSGNIQTLLEYSNPPAIIPAEGCYYYMFNNCSSLTQAPELPATSLAINCYRSMFYHCSSLTKAPELPATTLIAGCYNYMFNGCTSLKINTSSGTKIFTCPSDIPINAVDNMFGSTGGSFTGTPTSGNTYYWTE